MPVVGAGLRHDIELASRRMSVFRRELVRQQREFSDRLLNYGLRRAVGINLVVIHTVD